MADNDNYSSKKDILPSFPFSLSLRYACHLVSVSVSVAVSVSISASVYIYRSIFVCMGIKHLIVSDLLQGPRLD